MATKGDRSAELATDPAIPVPPVAWSDDPGPGPEPQPQTPADDKIKLGLAAGSFVAMAAALVAGHELAAAAFGGLVTTIVGAYFNRRNQ